MTVDDLGAYVKTPWPTIRAAWLEGNVCPPARPADGDPEGGGRDPQPGPPARAGPVHRARAVQVLQEEWDPPML